MDPKMTPEELEKFIHRELRALPPRKAPAGFEARVLAEIERRAAIAWYHKSWSYWPAPVRAAFLGLGTGVAAMAVAAFYLFSQGAAVDAIAQDIGSGFAWIGRIYHAGVWVVKFSGDLVGSIPPLWLYGGLACIASLYATFVGLGTAAFRFLYRNN